MTSSVLLRHPPCGRRACEEELRGKACYVPGVFTVPRKRFRSGDQGGKKKNFFANLSVTLSQHMLALVDGRWKRGTGQRGWSLSPELARWETRQQRNSRHESRKIDGQLSMHAQTPFRKSSARTDIHVSLRARNIPSSSHHLNQLNSLISSSGPPRKTLLPSILFNSQQCQTHYAFTPQGLNLARRSKPQNSTQFSGPRSTNI